MTEEWEYEEEAMQAEAERQKQARFLRMPAICRRCRWLDWYYTEECTHHAWPQNGRCGLFARDWYFRPRWLWRAWIRVQNGWWSLRHREYVRNRYRDRQSAFYNLGMWLRKVRLGRQVRAWLRANGPERTAAYCMFHLNRQAHYGGAHKPLIYHFKNHLVRLFYEQGLCTQCTLQVQKLGCWNCGGSGEVHNWDSDECPKCGGTGVFREHILYRFAFDVAGRRYVWHQPQGLVTWRVRVDMARLGEYHSAANGDKELEDDVRELYLMAVYEYLRLRGVTGRDMDFHFPSLGWALAADVKRVIGWRRRTERIRRVWQAVKRLWAFAQTGVWPAEDGIPF